MNIYIVHQMDSFPIDTPNDHASESKSSDDSKTKCVGHKHDQSSYSNVDGICNCVIIKCNLHRHT